MAPKALIAEAYRDACTSCMDTHKRRRWALQSALQKALRTCGTEVGESERGRRVVQSVGGLMACLGLARAEVAVVLSCMFRR